MLTKGYFRAFFMVRSCRKSSVLGSDCKVESCRLFQFYLFLKVEHNFLILAQTDKHLYVKKFVSHKNINRVTIIFFYSQDHKIPPFSKKNIQYEQIHLFLCMTVCWIERRYGDIAIRKNPILKEKIIWKMARN
jgi:hypothetical protein